KPSGDRKRGEAGRSGSSPERGAAIASAAKPGAAGRRLSAGRRSQARRSRALGAAAVKPSLLNGSELPPARLGKDTGHYGGRVPGRIRKAVEQQATNTDMKDRRVDG